jgi:23S rRNA (guanosine2251-2'-O)-methyltransferase
VLELLAAGRRTVKQVWISEGLDPSPELDRITSLAHRAGARLQVIPSRRLDAEARTRSPQGVVALAAPLQETPLDEICEPVGPAGATRPPFVLVLDGVTDPQNVGALLRIAECAGVTGVVLGRHGGAHVTPSVAKVAAGAVEHLRIAIAPGIPTAIARLETSGVSCIGLEAGAPLSIYELGAGEFDLESGVALVVGDEGKGLSSLTKKRCKILTSIPQQGSIGSLNVAAAGAVACFEVARQMGGRVSMGATVD